MTESINIQIVSRDKALSDRLVDILQEHGYTPFLAGNWQEAIEQVDMDFPLVALVDMQSGSGLEIVQKIKETFPITECIILVDELDQGSVIDAIRLGASNYVLSPPDPDLLVAIIRRVLEQLQIQRIYRDSESRFRSIVETADQGIVLLDSRGMITYWNEAAVATFGYSKGELVNQPLTKIILEDDRQKFDQALKQFIESGDPAVAQPAQRCFGLRKDGSKFPAEFNLLLFESAGRQFFTATVHDLTAQIEIQQDLSRSEQTFKNFVDGSPMGVHMYRLDSKDRLIFLGANPAADRILGVENQQFVGKTIEEAFPPLAETEVPERYRRAAALGQAWRSEQIRYKDDQIEGAYEVFAFQIAPNLVAIFFADITDRKRTESELQILYTAVEQINSAVAVINRDEKVEFANPKFYQMGGFEPENVIGKKFDEFIAPDSAIREKYPEIAEAVYQRGIPWRSDIRGQLQAEEPTWRDATVFPIKDNDGEITHLIYLSMDITERVKAETALRESEERYRGLFESVPVGLYRTTPDGQVVDANQSLVEILGYPSKQALIETDVSTLYIDPDQREHFLDALDQEGIVRAFPIELRRWDGETIWVEGYTRFISDDDEQVTMEGALVDVTERVWTERALQESETRLQTLSSATFEGIALTDAGKIIDANAQFADILGYGLDEVIGTQVMEHVYPDDREFVSARSEAKIEEPYEHRAVRKDGSLVVVEVRPRTVDIGGRKMRITAVRDVTERRQTEEQLRLQAAALDAAANGIIIVELGGEIIWANQAMEDLSGYSVAELIGETPEIFSSGMHDEAFYEEMGRILLDKRVWQGEIINKHKNGRFYPESQTIAPVLNASGEITHYVAIKQNISERKRAEDALRASEEKFSTIFQASPNPISISSFPDGVFVDVNQSFVDNSGYTQEELIGQSVLDIGLWTRQDERVAMIRALQRDGNIRNFEADYRRKNGDISIALISADLIQLDGEQYLLSSIQDIFERKQVENENQRRVRQLTAINQMGQVVTASLNIEQVLADVVNIVPSLLMDAEGVSLLFLEDDEFVFAAASGRVSESLRDLRIPADSGVAGKVFETQKPILISDLSDQTQIYKQVDEMSGYQTTSLLAVPLISGGEIIGILEAVHSKPNAFGQEDLNLLETTAAWTAIALDNARQHVILQRQLQESQALSEISQALTETLDQKRVLQLIVDSARQIIPGVERAVIHLYDEIQDLLTPISVSSVYDMGQPYLSMKPGLGVAGQVLESGRTINVKDTADDPRFIPVDGKTSEYLRSLLVAPVQSGDQKLGTISVSSADVNVFQENDENLLAILGVQAALAIETANLFEETRQRAHYLEMLNDMTSTSLRIPNLDTLLQSLAGQLVVLFDADGCYMNLWDENRRCITQTAAHGPGIVDSSRLRPPPSERTMTQSVLEAGRVIAVEDVFDSPYLSPKIAAQFPACSLLGMPLIAGRQKIGSALIGFNQPHVFLPDEISRAEQISQQVSLAIAKAQLLEAEQRRRQEAETLREVATTLTSTLEIDVVLDRILSNLEQVIPYDSAGVIIIEPDALRIEAVRGFENPEIVLGKTLPIDSPIYRQIKDEGQAIVVENVEADPRWNNRLNLGYIRAWIGTPLIVQQEVIGYLTVDNRQAGAYSQIDASLAQAFANQAAVAIYNARLFDSTRRRLSEVNTLYRINNQIVATPDVNVDHILREVVHMLWEDFGYYHVHVFMFDEEQQSLTVQQGSGPIGEELAAAAYRLSIEEGVVGYVATVGEVFMSNDVASVHFYKPNKLLPETHAELATPLRARGQLLGVLDIQHRAPNIFTEDDLRLIRAVADQLAVVLDKAILYAELEAALNKEKSARAQLVQSEKLAAMGRLIASVAHELNNPLQAIQNALYLVKMEENLTAQASEDIQVALDETNRMGGLISRLRDTYRPAEPEEFQIENLNALIREVHKLIGTHLRHNDVAFKFVPDGEIPAILMNPDHIKQVILNLCMNGIESMPEGGQLTVETLNLPAEDKVMMKVTDTGPGIAAEVIPRIFEPFFTTKQSGTGLGLYISYEIVENHAGTLEVISDGVRGSTFQFTLPIEMGIDLDQRRSDQ